MAKRIALEELCPLLRLEARMLLPLKTLAYGVACHAFSDYFQMSESMAAIIHGELLLSFALLHFSGLSDQITFFVLVLFLVPLVSGDQSGLPQRVG